MWPRYFEAKATRICPLGVLEDEDSPQGLHTWSKVICCVSSGLLNPTQSLTHLILLLLSAPAKQGSVFNALGCEEPKG